MANITIDDLTESRELDHQAMKNLFGGRGALGYLFSMWPTPRVTRGNGGGVHHYVTQFFIDTLQINDQDVNIIDSDNAQVAQTAGNTSISPNIFTANPLSTSLPTTI